MALLSTKTEKKNFFQKVFKSLQFETHLITKGNLKINIGLLLRYNSILLSLYNQYIESDENIHQYLKTQVHNIMKTMMYLLQNAVCFVSIK